MQAKNILYMQNPDNIRQNLELAEIKPSKLLEGETPRLIDEWHMDLSKLNWVEKH